jgi:hypothetical protein
MITLEALEKRLLDGPVKLICDDGTWGRELASYTVTKVNSACLVGLDANDMRGQISINNVQHYAFVEPEEKTYNLLELEEGEEYSCDETPAIYRRVGEYLQFWLQDNGKWVNEYKFFRDRTFRKIQKKLTFKDLEVGTTYINSQGAPVNFVGMNNNSAVFGGKVMIWSKTEEEIATWTKK